MTSVFKFYITTICIIGFQNKCTYVVTWFICYMADIVALIYSKISPQLEKERAQ